MSTTVTAPIDILRINHNLYVGEGFFTTTQIAVDFSRQYGGGFAVIIPANYAGGEAISALTGGQGTTLRDERSAQLQHYVWNGTNFVPADFVQAKGYVTTGRPTEIPGSTLLGFDPAGANGNGNGDLRVTAVAGMGMPALSLECEPSDGTTFHTFLRCDADPTGRLRIQVPQSLEILNLVNEFNLWTGEPYANGAKGMTVQAKPTENAVDLQGQTVAGAYDQTIRLNSSGGNVELAITGTTIAGGYISKGMPAATPASTLLGFDPNGSSGIGSGNLRITALAGKGMPAINLQGQPSDGNPLHTFIRCDTDPTGRLRIQAPQSLELVNSLNDFNLWMGEAYANGAKGMTVQAKPTQNAIEFQAQTAGGAYDQTIRLNDYGGDVELAINGKTTARDTVFSTCIVNNSPVRTFANSSDGGGMVFPPIGIGVSDGDRWANSIDPAAIPYLNRANAGVLQAQGYITTGTPAATPASTVLGFDPAGASSNGQGIVLATALAGKGMPALNLECQPSDGNPLHSFIRCDADATGRLRVQAPQSLELVNPVTGFNLWTGETYANGAKGMTVQGKPTANAIDLQGQTVAGAYDQTIRLNSTGGNVELAINGTTTARDTVFSTCSVSGDVSIGSGNINSTTDISFNSVGTHAVYLNRYGGSGGVYFGDGGNNFNARIDSAGKATFNGGVTATNIAATAGLTFDVPNSPLLADFNAYTVGGWYFVNTTIPNAPPSSDVRGFWMQVTGAFTGFDATLQIAYTFNVLGESFFRQKRFGTWSQWYKYGVTPVTAVRATPLEAYSGEGQTVDGIAEVILPSDFEEIAALENRTVSVTALFEDDTESFVQLAASRVVNGRFRVRSATPQRFYWEVNAVARGGAN